MKSVHSGFLLIELSIYVALALFLSWLIISFTARRITVMSQEQQTAQRLVQIHTSFAALKKIIKHFEKPIEHWSVRSANEIIVARNGQEHRGFLIEASKLWYLSGIYSPKKNQWIKKSKSLIFDKVKQARFEIQTINKQPIVVSSLILKAEFELPNKKTYQAEQWYAISGAI
ncbi:MAG TPA: hypothetical protein VHO47_02695 [Candidatus Babeliales bacterium]|nr:hypothetical protein [Candidatus Babeliales bacterium]